MSDTYLTSTTDNLAHLHSLDRQVPVAMLNLHRFKPNGGREQYRTYGAVAGPFLQKSGAQVQYFGDILAPVIGPQQWDEVALVTYPSLQNFLDMIEDPGYPSELREKALLDSRLYCIEHNPVLE